MPFVPSCISNADIKGNGLKLHRKQTTENLHSNE
jgi:hypothetical protein